MDMREAFETKMVELGHFPEGHEFNLDKNGRYYHYPSEIAWRAWQAALSHIGDGSKAEPVGMEEWMEGVKSEDKAEFGHHIQRPVGEWMRLYESYVRSVKRTHAAPTAQDSKVPEYRNALVALTEAEAQYRYKHDLHGSWHLEAGRAWDAMRRAGDSARLLLSAAPVPVPDTPQWVGWTSMTSESSPHGCSLTVRFESLEDMRACRRVLIGLQRPEAPEKD